MSRFRIVRVTNHAIRIQAGETFCPPTPPTREVRNVRIEDNAFDNTGISDALDSAIRVWTDPAAAASDATIANVRIVRNTFRAYADGGLIVNANGTNCVIRDLLIQDNTFVDTPFQLELASNTGSSNRIVGTRIIRNRFRNGTVPLFLGHIAADRPSVPAASGNVIEDTVVSGNVFSGTLDSLTMIGGFTDGGSTRATGNLVRDTRIVNNVIATGRGIHITGGAAGGTGNLVDGVEIANNTIVTQPLAGLRVDSNRDGGTENGVTGVSVLNTVFVGPRAGVTGPENELAGEVTPAQVRSSLTSTPGFAGVNGNLAADPRFVDPAQGDFHLQPGSPAVDAGSSEGAPPADLECRRRVGIPDTGAFESGGASGPCEDVLPGVEVALNGSQFRSGQTVRIGVTVGNPSIGWAADLYVGALLPDGQTALFFAGPGRLAGATSLAAPAGFPRVETALPGFVLSEPSFFEFVFPPTGVAPGTYQVFGALVRQGALADDRIDPGDILGLDVKPLRFSP